MHKILAPVGRGGKNIASDVKVVQQLLNQHRIPTHTTPLRIDGLVGPKTIARIDGFQKNIVKMVKPDGRVDPYGKTIAALVGKTTTSAIGKNYRNGRYAVQVGTDGSIRVKPGDWISKYSAAIHNDFVHVFEYGRKNAAGQIQPITDINRIVAGETIYHIPTAAKAAHQPTPTPTKKLTDAQSKELILATLQGEFNLRGENLKTLSDAIDIIGYTDTALTLTEIAGLIAEGSVLSSVAGGVAIVSAILGPVGLMIAFVNASESGLRTYGMRSVAYTITAWSFDDPVPAESKQIMKALQTPQFPMVHTAELPRYHEAWKKASQTARQHIEQEVSKRRVSKKSLQALLKASSSNKRTELCLSLLQGFEKEIDHLATKRTWQHNYKILYPD